MWKIPQIATLDDVKMLETVLSSSRDIVHLKVHKSSLGRYVFGSEISYNKAPPRLPGLGC